MLLHLITPTEWLITVPIFTLHCAVLFYAIKLVLKTESRNNAIVWILAMVCIPIFIALIYIWVHSSRQLNK